MIVARIDGGIGNQFFQYAFARSLSIDANVKLVLDIRHLLSRGHRDFVLDQIGAPYDRLISNEEDLRFGDIMASTFFSVKETSVNFCSNAAKIKKTKYLKGFWQTDKYFNRHSAQLIKDLTDNDIFQNVSHFLVDGEETASIHIRRGDYLENEKYFHVGAEYFKKAAAIASSVAGINRFLVFSDDVDWVKKNIDIKNASFADDLGLTALEEIYLMSLCRVNIIANSTFSWWGAYLNMSKNKKVICPNRWYGPNFEEAKDIYPDSWRPIDC